MRIKPSTPVVIASVVAVFAAGHTHLEAQIFDSAKVWYAELLRQHFQGQTIENGGSRFPRNDIALLWSDITTFDVNVQRSGSTFSVQGSVTIRALPRGASTLKGRYMLHLDVFVFGPDGRFLWKQNGFPQGGAWVQASGETRRFTLIDAVRGAIPRGSTLIVLASGDPISGVASYVTRVILGAKTVKLWPATTGAARLK